MNWFKRLFSTHREFTGEFIETGDDLIGLAASNQIVAAELAGFTERADGLSPAELKIEAVRSANALSGYGISISPNAFTETLQ